MNRISITNLAAMILMAGLLSASAVAGGTVTHTPDYYQERVALLFLGPNRCEAVLSGGE